MGRLFGTDGVRGLANRDLTAELALDLSVAAAHVLGEAGSFEGHRPTAVVATDGRASGEFLSAAVVAGLASAGVDVLPVGAIPTPGAAFLVGDLGADLGVMLSASHNPMPDNGIKFFSRGGHKLADDLEDAITDRMREPWDRPTGRGVGRVHPARDTAVQRYTDHLLAAVPGRLDGLTVVVDCAHGAASHVAPQAYAAAGATVIPVACEPDGWNINDGVGSTHVEVVQKAVVEHGADLGLAHDGDADRCLAVAADGTLVDGDAILAVLALALRDGGRLAHDTVVTTVMTNLGFHHAMKAEGITVQETPVGDRYVLEVMRAGGFSLGGEQSGHVIALDHATTGDGLLTGLMLMQRMAQTGRSLADLAAVMTALPQVLVNVPVADRDRAMDDGELLAAVEHAQAELDGTGRVLVRPSGTEQLVRVMVEAATAEHARTVADRVAQFCR